MLLPAPVPKWFGELEHFKEVEMREVRMAVGFAPVLGPEQSRPFNRSKPGLLRLGLPLIRET